MNAHEGDVAISALIWEMGLLRRGRAVWLKRATAPRNDSVIIVAF